MPVIPYAQGSWSDVANQSEEKPSGEEVVQGALANMAEGLSNSLFGGASLRAGYRLGADLRVQAPSLALGGDRSRDVWVSQDDANKQITDAGVKVSGIGENGISQGALDMLVDHQQHEQERAQLIQRSGQTGIAGFAERMVGDPMMLVPMGDGLGLIAHAGTDLVSKIGAGAVAAGTDTAALEAMNYPVQRYSGDDYTMADSLRNVALGTALGGAFGAGAHAIENFNTRRTARLNALASVADDRPVDMTPFAGPMNAHTIGTGEDIANSLVSAPESPTTRDEALMRGYMEPAPARPEVQAELDRVNRLEPAKLNEEDRLHPANADELSEAVTGELKDTEAALAHSPAALKQLEEPPAATNDNWLDTIKEGINCARTNGAP